MPKGGFFEKMHIALSLSETRLYNDGLSILDSAIPDNAIFTAQDATQWERRLGLISNPLVSLANRKLAISQKMAHPGEIYGRQHYLFLERELRSAGFDVYVHENLSGAAPSGSFPYVQHGDFQHGDNQLGSSLYPLIVNSLDAEIDADFNIGGTFRNIFYIGGVNVGDSANVEAIREKEFRQLILRVKPTHMIGIMLINYI